MKKRTLIGAAAFSLALAGGGVAGAVLGTPSVSSAQDGTTSTTTADSGSTTRADHPRPGLRHPRLEVLKVAADTLGMKPADLLQELKDGKSIADVAKEKGVDEQKVVDAIVADGTAKLQEEITKLPDQAKTAVEHDGLPEGPRGFGRGGHPDGPPPVDGPPPAQGDGSSSSTTS
jgi:hypothetical protein